MAAQPDLVSDLFELLAADIMQLLALGRELLVDLDRLLGHLLVGVLRSADQGEVGTRGHPLVPVGVEADAQEQRFPFAARFLLQWLRHRGIDNAAPPPCPQAPIQGLRPNTDPTIDSTD